MAESRKEIQDDFSDNEAKLDDQGMENPSMAMRNSDMIGNSNAEYLFSTTSNGPKFTTPASNKAQKAADNLLDNIPGFDDELLLMTGTAKKLETAPKENNDDEIMTNGF